MDSDGVFGGEKSIFVLTKLARGTKLVDGVFQK